MAHSRAAWVCENFADRLFASASASYLTIVCHFFVIYHQKLLPYMRKLEVELKLFGVGYWIQASVFNGFATWASFVISGNRCLKMPDNQWLLQNTLTKDGHQTLSHYPNWSSKFLLFCSYHHYITIFILCVLSLNQLCRLRHLPYNSINDQKTHR